MAGNLAIVGKKETVLPFLATGAKVFFVKEGETRKVVEELINQGMKIIFFAEEFTQELTEVLARYKTETFPCLIPFPTGRAKTKIAIGRIRDTIKKAVGADVFFEEVG